MPPVNEEHLDISALETWLWDAACALRGSTDAPKYKDFILPLVFYKRLSDVFDDEFTQQIEEYGSEELAREIVERDHEDALKTGGKPVVRFYVPQPYAWNKIRNFSLSNPDIPVSPVTKEKPKNLGEFLTDAMREVARLNPDLDGVLNVKDYNEKSQGERIVDDERLASLIEVVSRHRLGLNNAEPDILGRAYEYLLRKFAEGQGQSAGEFYTPKEVGWLMARILDPSPRSTVYDPTCGSGGLLIKARLQYKQTHPTEQAKAPQLYGQESNPVTLAIAKMNMFLHDFMESHFARPVDTLRSPGFGAEGAGLKQFDYIIANPMWNQDSDNMPYLRDDAFFLNDSYKRFDVRPHTNNADWAWVQHMWASLNENGRAAIVLDTGAVSRGSGKQGSDKERDVRRHFVENDRIEGVILLPDNLFYNTTAPGIILFLNKNKPAERKNQIILINASTYFVKEKPKNVLLMNGDIDPVVNAFKNWQTVDKLSRVISLEDARKADYNLSPSQFVETGEAIVHRQLKHILDDLREAKIEREQADKELSNQLQTLMLGV